MTENHFDYELNFLVVVVILFFVLLMVVRFAMFINDFSHELRFLNTEIRRTSGSERKRWLRRKRKLWLSLLPFFKY